MSPELVSILGLVLMFVLGTALPVNMGALAFALAFLVGTFSVGMSANAILAGFPGELFVTLVGITYLFAIAQRNGTIDLLVRLAVRAVGGRVALIPWVMFAIAAALTAVGAVSPAAVAVIAPIALRFSKHYGIDPLMMGLLVVHGAQGGGFSPVSIYGGITNGIVERAGLPGGELSLFLASLLFNLAVAVGVFFAFGGRALLRGHRLDPSLHAERNGRASVAVSGHGGTPAAPRRDDEAPPADDGAPATRDQVLTLAGLVALAVGALAFSLNVGLVAITVAVALALLSPQAQKGAVDKVSWSTVLLISGVITYVAVLQKAGAVDMVSGGVTQLGAPLLAALLLCYVGGVVSAFASSTGVLGATIPLAVPFLMQGHIGPSGMIAALAISATIVDVSPFSTNGALVLANASDAERDALFRRFLIYSGLVVALGPLLAWLVLVVPGWL